MCILYNANTKKYAQVAKKNNNHVATIVDSIDKATDIDNSLADSLLKKCTSKLKGFQKANKEKLIEVEKAEKEALAAKAISEEKEEIQESKEKNESEEILKTPRRAFTQGERSAIYVRDRGICGICGKFVPPDDYTIDHIIPISLGGSYDAENLQCCCKKCNQLKADTLPEDFFQRMLDVIEFQLNQGNKNVKKGLKKIIKRHNLKIKKKNKH